MRIVAGIFGGRRLHAPKNNDIRPTSDKVRGAIFNTLNAYLDLDGASVLDAFCGTGALGLEAISRGAQHCLFVDKARQSLDLAKENARSLDASGNCAFMLGDAGKVQSLGDDPCDLVFLDPPYGQDLVASTLEHLIRQKALSESAICVLETEKNYVFEGFKDFEVLKEKTYSDTLVTYLRYRKSVA